MKNQPLLRPFQLGRLHLTNSMVMAPLTRDRSDNSDLAATDLTATYYEQRATAGLIISEGTNISKESVGYINVPGIYSEAQVKGWHLVTGAVHRQGSKIFRSYGTSAVYRTRICLMASSHWRRPR